jgi:coatomer subunit beta'
MLYSSVGDRDGMCRLVEMAREEGVLNVAIVASFMTGQVETAMEILVKAKRVPEAAFLARTYCPSKVSEMVALWRDDLVHVSERAASALADPSEYSDLFPDLEWALRAETLWKERRGETLPATEWSSQVKKMDDDMIEIIKQWTALAKEREESEAAMAPAEIPPATLLPGGSLSDVHEEEELTPDEDEEDEEDDAEFEDALEHPEESVALEADTAASLLSASTPVSSPAPVPPTRSSVPISPPPVAASPISLPPPEEVAPRVSDTGGPPDHLQEEGGDDDVDLDDLKAPWRAGGVEELGDWGD